MTATVGNLVERIAALEAENRRLREACEAALEYISDGRRVRNDGTLARLRAALESKP